MLAGDVEQDVFAELQASRQGGRKAGGEKIGLAGAGEADEKCLVKRAEGGDGRISRTVLFGRAGERLDVATQFFFAQQFRSVRCGFGRLHFGGCRYFGRLFERTGRLATLDKRIDHVNRQVFAAGYCGGMGRTLGADDLHEGRIADRGRAGEENRRNGHWRVADQERHRLRHVRALREGGCRLAAGFVAGGGKQRLEQFRKLLQVGPARMTQSFKTGHGRHQDDILQPSCLRPFQLTKPVRHGYTYSYIHTTVPISDERSFRSSEGISISQAKSEGHRFERRGRHQSQ